jgi:hypothetical protein
MAAESSSFGMAVAILLTQILLYLFRKPLISLHFEVYLCSETKMFIKIIMNRRDYFALNKLLFYNCMLSFILSNNSQ